MSKTKIELPSKLTKENWFYEANKELLDPHLGKFYISYSTVSSWEDYRTDFIKQKIANITLPDSVYSKFGNWVGESVELNVLQANNYGFTGGDNISMIRREPSDKYERMILIDRGEYVIIGFIDILREPEPKVVDVEDIKTGGSGKEKGYTEEKYVQVVLYSKALQDEGYTIRNTGVWFCRRTGSHIKPPLNLSTEQFYIPLEYNQERVDYALNKVDRVVKEVSEYWRTYKKFF